SSGLRADIAGREAPVTRKGEELSFAFPGEGGSFSGSFEGRGLIRGHWTGGRTAISYGRAATPVVLKALGPGRWSGIVDPGEEEFSFYIHAQWAADGSYAAVLRNPEFDLGNQQKVSRLVRAGDALELVGTRGD